MWPCGQSTFSRLPTPQRLPCRLPVVSKVKFFQRSQFTSRHTLQLPFMSLPSCSSKQPLLVVLYFGGAHLAATFGVSPQNCTHLIPHVNLLAVCRSSKQQHFCAAQKHFRTSAGHCGESCIPTTGPSAFHRVQLTQRTRFSLKSALKREAGEKEQDPPLPKCLTC